MTDTDIKNNVVAELIWDNRIDETNITVDVDNGVVTLKGNVYGMFQKRIAEIDATQVMGVLDVNNNLEVTYAGIIKVPPDVEIAERIRNIIMWDQDLNSFEINVKINKGIVTLSGNVNSYWKKYYAEDIASNVMGVIGVINQIVIVPTENIEDHTIAEDIEGSLERRLAVNEDDIDVQVEEGVVTISGEVENWASWRAAMDAVVYTSGVKDIEDRIRIETED